MTHPLDLIFAALSDPTRRAILAMLLEDDMAVTDVAEPFAMSLAAISKHLTLLAEAGLIAQEKRGRNPAPSPRGTWRAPRSTWIARSPARIRYS